MVALACAALLMSGRCARDSTLAALAQGRLAFVANTSGNWDLFLLVAGQSAPTRLTETPVDERAPAISPDLNQIAYVTSDGSLWLMDVERKQTRQLGGPPARYGYPAWTPDGKALVYTSYTFGATGEDAELFSYSIADRKQRLLVQQTGPQDFPAISSSGDRVAYVSSIATLLPQMGSIVTQQLWVASLRDGTARQLFSGTFRDTRPAWSPDGRWIACSSDRGGTTDIWLVDAGNASATRLTTGPGAKTSPTWSPDGRELAFITNAGGTSELFAIDVASKHTHRVIDFPSKRVEIRDPAWR